MNSRERVLTALDHQEPDRVPIDLGGTVVTSIAISTYAALREHLGLAHLPVRTLETVQQIAVVDDDMLDLFGVDVIPVFANPPVGYQAVFVDEGPRGSRSAMNSAPRYGGPRAATTTTGRSFRLPSPRSTPYRKCHGRTPPM